MANIISKERKENCLKNDENKELPKNFILFHDISNSFSFWGLDNAHTIFNFNNINYLIYATINKSIII